MTGAGMEQVRKGYDRDKGRTGGWLWKGVGWKGFTGHKEQGWEVRRNEVQPAVTFDRRRRVGGGRTGGGGGSRWW
ncbi:hypothetical protein Pmani_011488 [Petrolisthes manimaculis]|uniref:Uncharacterized protein n=1 Tax=Petrolisthes manimaculis TaxID=1843537 RepID=A0AAE1Q0M3_9EUCA|nr:hypothetical protein Pmani_011488 [Petrolisthes manimaculis]